MNGTELLRRLLFATGNTLTRWGDRMRGQARRLEARQSPGPASRDRVAPRASTVTGPASEVEAPADPLAPPARAGASAGPPAHWVALVRAGAPEFLEQLGLHDEPVEEPPPEEWAHPESIASAPTGGARAGPTDGAESMPVLPDDPTGDGAPVREAPPRPGPPRTAERERDSSPPSPGTSVDPARSIPRAPAPKDARPPRESTSHPARPLGNDAPHLREPAAERSETRRTPMPTPVAPGPTQKAAARPTLDTEAALDAEVERSASSPPRSAHEAPSPDAPEPESPFPEALGVPRRWAPECAPESVPPHGPPPREPRSGIEPDRGEIDLTTASPVRFDVDAAVRSRPEPPYEPHPTRTPPGPASHVTGRFRATRWPPPPAPPVSRVATRRPDAAPAGEAAPPGSAARPRDPWPELLEDADYFPVEATEPDEFDRRNHLDAEQDDEPWNT